MSSGARIQLYYAPETQAGVTPTDAVWQTVRRVTDGLTENVTTENSASVTDSRFRQGGMATQSEITGSLAVELSVGLFDDFWSAVAMNDWDNNVLKFGGNTQKTYTFVKVFADIGQIFIYRGVRLNQGTLSIQTTGKINATFGLMGTDFERTTTNPIKDPKPVADAVVVSTPNVGALIVNGQTVVGTACLQSAELTINNNMEAIRCIGNRKLSAQTYQPKMVDITLNTQYIFSGQSAGYIDYVKSRDTMPVYFEIEDSKGNKYALNFPQLEVSEANHPDGGGEDTIQLSVNFNHIKTSPTITRTLV